MSFCDLRAQIFSVILGETPMVSCSRRSSSTATSTLSGSQSCRSARLWFMGELSQRKKRTLFRIITETPQQRRIKKLTLAERDPYELLGLWPEYLTPLKKDMSLNPSYQGVWRRYCIVYLGLTNNALVYEPKCGGGGKLRGLRLSQWVQLYTGAQKTPK